MTNHNPVPGPNRDPKPRPGKPRAPLRPPPRIASCEQPPEEQPKPPEPDSEPEVIVFDDLDPETLAEMRQRAFEGFRKELKRSRKGNLWCFFNGLTISV